MTERILTVDSDVAAAESLELLLPGEEYEVLRAANAEIALEQMESTAVDVVFCELGMRGLDELDILPQIARRQPGIPIILMSERPSPEHSAEAMRRGAYGLVSKPLSSTEIQFALHRVRDRERLRRSNALWRRDMLRSVGDRPIVAASPLMIEVLEAIEGAAGAKTPALLTGERGTGKEVLARAIHAQSPRRNQPFVAVSCTAASQERLESQLFGHAKKNSGGAEGARRGLLMNANGGSLFLDEIGELSRSLQSRLLSFVQTGELAVVGASKACSIDVRVIAATSRNSRSDTQSGHLDEELFYRLSAAHIPVPALRDRRQDIPLLVDHFMARFGETLGHSTLRLADDALARLTEYSWPGNLRELENVVERAMILADGGRITLQHLPVAIMTARSGDAKPERHDFSLRRARRAVEAAMIERALSATQGNRTHAAKLLEISHRALLYKLKEYQIRS